MEHNPSETRTALLNAALVCFAQRGFDGTSIRMIADRAQRPLSLLAHHFGNKEGLYQEVFKMIFENTILKREGRQAPKDGCTPRDKEDAVRLLREFIHLIFEDTATQQSTIQGSSHDYGTQLWLQEIRAPRPNLTAILRAYMKPFSETIRQCIHTLRPELSEAEVVFMGISIVGMISGHSLMRGLNQVVWNQTEPIESPFQASEQLVDLCLRGLLGSSGRG